ncbi:DUF3846 domain-containing protein [Sinorhizobium terangae]|uniref:DUF3846 domain-containing protein n=1 Tax=Sinorhizobium terangae TaxID=110322 RepID=UPI0024B20847|nr:DUF3846 domain-containing protein [Sinorhizobium terangae]WFU50217.1 DUF3846 domain-containing protein [Sinorhizobium terangae]
MKTTKAYLVEPLSGTIRVVSIPQENRLAVMRSLIGCNRIDFVRMDDRLAVVVDDNGLNGTLPCLTRLDGYPSPLAGNLLIIGTDENGDPIDVAAGIDEIAGRFTIVRPVLRPVFEVLEGTRIFGRQLCAMEVRIELRPPTVVSENIH